MSQFLQGIVSGIAVGAIYALVAIGFNIIYSTTKILNFAQGEFLAIGALVSFQFQFEMGWPLPLALLATIAVLIVTGLVVEKMVMIPTRLARSSFGWIISTLAVALIIRNGLTLPFLPFGTEPKAPKPLVDGRLDLGIVGISWQRVLILVFAVLIMVAVEFFFTRTFTGKALQATSNNSPVASLMGIPVNWMISLSFILSAVITGLAGFLIAPITGADAYMGLDLGIKGFVAAVLGGMGSPRGAILGGFLIGLVEGISTVIFSSPNLANVVVYSVLAVVLLLKPTGLASLRSPRRVAVSPKTPVQPAKAG